MVRYLWHHAALLLAVAWHAINSSCLCMLVKVCTQEPALYALPGRLEPVSDALIVTEETVKADREHTLILDTLPSSQAGAPALLLGCDPLVLLCVAPASSTTSSAWSICQPPSFETLYSCCRVHLSKLNHALKQMCSCHIMLQHSLQLL